MYACTNTHTESPVVGEDEMLDEDEKDGLCAVGEGMASEGPEADYEEWELLLERPMTTENAPSRKHVQLPAGSWATPEEDRAALAPGSRIQRRVPDRCFQVHIIRPDHSYSKTFKWAESGSPTPDEVFQQAVTWSWDEWSKMIA